MKFLLPIILIILSICLITPIAFAAGLSIPQGSAFNLGSATLIVTGEVNNSGTLEISTGTIQLTGNWTNSGDFISGTGTVEFIGASGEAQNISGKSSFYNFRSVTGGLNLTFEATATQTMEGTLILSGEAGKLITLRSTLEGTRWGINPKGSRIVNYVDVKDSNNINIIAINPLNSDNSGNNINWWPAYGIILSLTREANTVGSAIIISWQTSPEGQGVDLYRLATTDATASIYTNEATPWGSPIYTNLTLSATKELNQVGTGYAQAYYKVIPTGQSGMLGTAEAVGKVNLNIPVGLSLMSTPLLPINGAINSFLGNQLSSSDKIYYFTGAAWLDSTLSGGSWSGGVANIVPDQGYWVRIQSGNPAKIPTLCGSIESASQRTIALNSGLNLSGTAYPISVSLEASGLGSALTSPSSGTGKLYYFTGAAWLDSTWTGSVWTNKGITHLQPRLGYWVRRNNSGSSNWIYPKLY